MTCHFVDDQVMPGTLMYECCLHTLRIFLMRMGWVGQRGWSTWQPVPGVASRALKCRGQVTAATKTVTYEIAIKEIGYGPEPFAIADALMYADGKAIVEIHRHDAATDWHVSPADELEASLAACRDRSRRLAAAKPRPCSTASRSWRSPPAGRRTHSATLRPSIAIGSSPGCPRRRIRFSTASCQSTGEPWTMAAGGGDCRVRRAGRRLVFRGRSAADHALRRPARGRAASVRLGQRLHRLGLAQRRSISSSATSAARGTVGEPVGPDSGTLSHDGEAHQGDEVGAG